MLDNILEEGKSYGQERSSKERQRSNFLTLILVEVESRSLLSALMSACSASVSTTAIINLPIWNPTLIKPRSLAKVSTIRGIH
jgi:hypothetical protein